MSTPSKEEIEEWVAVVRDDYAAYPKSKAARYVVALADERDRLAAENEQREAIIVASTESHANVCKQRDRLQRERDAMSDVLAEAARCAERSAAEHARLKEQRDEAIGLLRVYPWGDGAEPGCDIAVFGNETDECDGERNAEGKNIGGYCWEHRRRALLRGGK